MQDLFAEVRLYVALEERGRPLLDVGCRQLSVARGPRHVEIAAELARRQWMHAQGERAAREQVDVAAFQRARARPRQGEAKLAPLDQPMHLVEDGRNLLDLVEHDPAAVALRHHGVEPLRRREQRGVDVGLQKVDEDGVRESVPEPARLAGAPRTEEKEALVAGWVKHSGVYEAISTEKMASGPPEFSGEGWKSGRRDEEQTLPERGEVSQPSG